MEPINKKIIVLAVIALVVVVGVLTMVLFGKNLFSRKPVVVDNKENIQTAANNDIIDKVRSTDADLDGLTDTQEKQYKTDSANPDSDGDGVMDGYEIEKTKTDPLKKDTDGDSLSDGYEVSRLMDPLKKNKLK